MLSGFLREGGGEEREEETLKELGGRAEERGAVQFKINVINSELQKHSRERQIQHLFVKWVGESNI